MQLVNLTALKDKAAFDQEGQLLACQAVVKENQLYVILGEAIVSIPHTLRIISIKSWVLIHKKPIRLPVPSNYMLILCSVRTN